MTPNEYLTLLRDQKLSQLLAESKALKRDNYRRAREIVTEIEASSAMFDGPMAPLDVDPNRALFEETRALRQKVLRSAIRITGQYRQGNYLLGRLIVQGSRLEMLVASTAWKDVRSGVTPSPQRFGSATWWAGRWHVISGQPFLVQDDGKKVRVGPAATLRWADSD